MEPSSCITGLYSKPSLSESAPNLTEIKSPNTKHEKFFSIPGRSNISFSDIRSSVESTPVVERSISVSSERGVDYADKNKVLGAESLKSTKETMFPHKPSRVKVPEQIKINNKEISFAEQKKAIEQVGPALLESKDTADFQISQTGSDFLETAHSHTVVENKLPLVKGNRFREALQSPHTLQTSHALESSGGVKFVGKVPFDIPEQILKFSDADRKITQLSSNLKEIAFNISNYQTVFHHPYQE